MCIEVDSMMDWLVVACSNFGLHLCERGNYFIVMGTIHGS